MAKSKFSPDVIINDFWKNNSRFADLFNTVIFGGKKVLKEADLTEKDTDVSTIIQTNKHIQTLKRTRDVIKKSALGMDFIIWAIENQKKIHYAMPLRKMAYDVCGYLNEYRDITAEYRNEKGMLAQNDEFLSKMKKEDRLHPIVSLVLYYGEKPWDGPLSLKDMMLDMPNEISSIFSDYKMNLVQIHDGDKYHFSNSDVQNVFTMCNHFYKFEKDKLLSNYKDKKLSLDVLQTVAAITNSPKFLSLFTTSEKGGMSMCSALELWEQEARQQGEETGKQIGLQSGINAYIELCKDFNLSFNAVVSRLIDKFSLTESDANAYVTQFGY